MWLTLIWLPGIVVINFNLFQPSLYICICLPSKFNTVLDFIKEKIPLNTAIQYKNRTRKVHSVAIENSYTLMGLEFQTESSKSMIPTVITNDTSNSTETTSTVSDDGEIKTSIRFHGY